MLKIKVVLDKPIVPDKMFFEGKKFIITEVDPEFIINQYYLYVDENQHIQKLSLVNKHPNCDLETGFFCLPEFVKKMTFSKEVKCMIHCWLGSFNLENCYYMPWGQCKYRLM